MGSDSANERPATLDARSGLSHDAIREQLDRILVHREFQATDKMRDFFRFVVEETLADRQHRIKGYTIATRVFGRGDDFDAAQDPIVSIQASRLRRALERYYLVAGGRDPIFIDIPKGRYIPSFAAQAVEPDTIRPGGSASGELEGDSPVGPSVAVLVFENLTGDPEQLFLTIGLTDELVTEMNRFQDIVVLPCQRASQTVGLPADPIEQARASGARFVLQGTVRRDVKTVKVSAHLTDAKSGRQIWAEAYTHPLEASSLIATQEEIARSVVAAIGSEYGIIARRLSAESRKKPPAELDTYEAMLRYYSHQIVPSPESSKACFLALQRAAEREPEYGPAWSALATLHCQMYSMDVPGFDQPLDTALRYARRGVSLEPGSQLGRLILAYACYLADDSDSFLHEIETALALNPNSPYTVGTAGYFHVMRGEFERGLPLLDRAIAVNPCHPSWFHGGYVVDHLRRLNYEGALVEVQNHSPFQSFWLPVVHAAILGKKLGRIDEAKVHIEEVAEQKPDFASRAHGLFWRTLKIDALIDDLIDGLRRAGLSVEGR
jgi:adenylate cyclase